MSDQLGLHMSRHQINSSQHLTRLQPPDGTGGVNAGSACRRNQHVQEMEQQQTPFQLANSGFLTQKIGINLIPVEGGEGSAEVRVLVVVQQTFKARFCVTDLCDECKTVEHGADFCKNKHYIQVTVTMSQLLAGHTTPVNKFISTPQDQRHRV